MPDPNESNAPQPDTGLLGPTLTSPIASSASSDGPTVSLPSTRRRGLLPGESSLSTGTLPGSSPLEQMSSAGRYQILERIGRGGMATVFKAHDPSIARDVAIKFLHASLCEGED